MSRLSAAAATAFARAARTAVPGSGLDRVVRGSCRAHAAVYRATSGRVGGRMGPASTCLLTTTGRRTGEPRTHVVGCVPVGQCLAVVASNSGRDQHPAWYLNLLADPRVLVRIGAEVHRMRARTATEEERAQLWPRFLAVAPVLQEYQDGTSRRIPIVLLHPDPAGSARDDGGPGLSRRPPP